ncbi:MAG: hypothetical protein IT372_10360, partial [Polyangiaceae bacterium]|nr:hypothetical protein [Polyangiaceae bacterium]
MSLDSVTATEKRDWVLSAEEAERLAARFRPSWEEDDDGGAVDADVEVDIADAGDGATDAAAAAPEALIRGVPTIAVGEAETSAAGEAAAKDAQAKGAQAKDAQAKPAADAAPAPAQAAPKPAPAPPAPPGRTKVGLGDAEPAAAARSARDTGAREDAARPPEDSIELPVTGGKGGLGKIAVAVVGVALLIIGARALLGGGDKDAAAPEPAAKPVAAATAAPQPTAAPAATTAAPADTAAAPAAPP